MFKYFSIVKSLVILLLLAKSQFTFAEFQGKDHMIASLLISEDPMEQKVGGKILEEIINPNVGLTDLAALRLSQNFQKTDKYTVDSNAWIIKALKQSKNKRYSTLLGDIRSQTDIEKLHKYLDDAIPYLTQGDSNDVDLTSINYTEAVNEINERLAKQPFNYGHIDSVKKGMKAVDVYKQLGYPSNVSYYVHTKRIPFVGRVRLQDTELIYEGSGAVRLRSEGGGQVVHSIKPDAAPTLAPDEIDSVLMSANGTRAVLIAKQLYRNKDYSQKLLDTAGNKIWLEKDNNNAKMVDAVAWLCKYIGASKNARYYSFIESLITSTENRKIIKYAKSALSMLPDTLQIDQQYTPSI
ncbi:MAG: hypothetical protein ACRBBR_14590 [Cellvibrionaceae bacterium]